jgi:hypothetical protein
VHKLNAAGCSDSEGMATHFGQMLPEPDSTVLKVLVDPEQGLSITGIGVPVQILTTCCGM